ncbi:MAG: 1,2-phenylacetyl-CoA epoxidase subunit PaaC [Bacteroidota bacterium]|nr:phenylacetate-CoA oxygenase subunit PaaC [Candidatus Kapabacteria bacterium]MCX7936787.1 phenylacetate-CoA oxygenase subunit PaaC [Chlorobiota bacterium]MDW8271355.1 1,2-phenylacetyl-CoA epoxidase subunit PaaC [Bacteroidota bacterium]
MTEQYRAALEDLLFRMADDALIYGHRNSEWTGLAPLLEEDIAFSSIAQDKLGHALALYRMLHEMGHPDPDQLAFMRSEHQFRCCHLVELPTQDYAVALMRHALFDYAEHHRYELLEESSYAPLAALARKVRGEIKYHIFHASTWLRMLGVEGTDESRARMQAALDMLFPYALGIFEPTQQEETLRELGIFPGEGILREHWLEDVVPLLESAGYRVPEPSEVEPVVGGRHGYHTEHLQPLLEEMTAVFRIDPTAEW